MPSTDLPAIAGFANADLTQATGAVFCAAGHLFALVLLRINGDHHAIYLDEKRHCGLV